MHRLLVATEELSKDAPTLSREAANHLKVLRPKDGEEIELFDGRGAKRTCSYAVRTATLTPRSQLSVFPPPAVSLSLFACVTKGSRWDWTIEKATELGVSRIVPVISDRTIVRIAPDERAAKRARWTRVAEDAARQSDAVWLPEVLAPVTFAESLALVRETTCFVGALTTPPPPPIAAALDSLPRTSLPLPLFSPPSHFAVYVGPEGDFTPAELAALLEIATPVSFGSTILRAETAAIYGISAVKAFLDAHAK